MFVIGFSYGYRNPISWLIKKLTKSQVSHAYLRFDILDSTLVIQSNHKGVEVDDYRRFTTQAVIVKEFRLAVPTLEQNKMLSFAIKQIDKPYDFKAMGGFLWVILNGFVGRKIKNPFRDKSAFYCSELALMALKEINFSGVENLDRELISPEALMEFLEKHPRVTKL